MLIKYSVRILLVFNLAALNSLAADRSENREPVFTIRFGSDSKSWTRQELLHSPSIKKIQIEKDPFQKGKRATYLAVPVSDLFAGIRVDPSSRVLYSCLDGFSASMEPALLLNKDPQAAIAYLAIDDVSKSWIQNEITDKSANPGPFYLIWTAPGKSNLGTEQWPFGLVQFEVSSAKEHQFPHMVPDSKVSAGSRIFKGYELFQKNCFACHTLNGEGHSQMGPDLNIPFNPTEYMGEKWIKKLVRNPQDLRRWPQGKMHGFDREALSDEDLQKIIDYLKHMSLRKVKM